MELFRLLTLSSLIFSTLVRKSSSRLVQASLWLSDVRAKKYATASLQTLQQTHTHTKKYAFLEGNQAHVQTCCSTANRNEPPCRPAQVKNRQVVVVVFFPARENC